MEREELSHYFLITTTKNQHVQRHESMKCILKQLVVQPSYKQLVE